MGNGSTEMETFRKNRKEMLEIKSTNEIKSLMGSSVNGTRPMLELMNMKICQDFPN